ncbi:MAG: hypothetical protein Q9191_003134 [Dirinaria sp. TL-2023a]
MDPVTAFSLAAGVLQVVDLSVQALSTCKEIYEDGSLAQHRKTEELINYLAETTERLEKSVSHAPTQATSESRAVVDVSRKCSETAAELCSELKKLRLDPQGGLRQSMSKSLRAMQKKKFLTESQEKLDKYQNVLNTRILSKLDTHAIQQIGELQTLDQSVKDLALALSQGFNTVTQLLAIETVPIKQHIDRRFEDQAHSEAIRRVQKQFKDGLFFPEIFARQDDIPKSHEGTCHWIFASNKVETRGELRSDSDVESNPESARSLPLSDFTDWLENGAEPYWLSGKPGSGKSTLMKYISTEFREFCQSNAVLSPWADGENLVVCSFFFWNIGSPLQKNYVGLLRSLLYQIAEQRPDLVPIMIGEEATQISKMSEARESVSMYAWTKERLDDALRRFLAQKPPSTRVCMFIDGLDEFVGDEDSLMNTVRLLSRTSRTKVCVSSRPEQIFRQGFANLPQLKLQDLNRRDIQQATRERLGSVLKEHFPQLDPEIDNLVQEVTYRSEGIFLWADLIIKDLKRGLRNEDNMQELCKRLDDMPGTVQGVYEHMLNRLDKPYFREATKYFHFLMAYQHFSTFSPVFYASPTLLHFACVEETVCEYDLSKDRTRFESFNFHESCNKLETRILTRCAGFLEIDDSRKPYIEGVGNASVRTRTSQRQENVSRHLREVRFIHKTVVEFLQSHTDFLQHPDWQLSACVAALRSALRVASLAPIAISEENTYFPRRALLQNEFVLAILHPYRDIGQALLQLADQTYNTWKYIETSLNESESSFSRYNTLQDFLYAQEGDYHPPFHDRFGFAAFFGFYKYLMQHVSKNIFSGKEINYLLSCAVLGIDAFVFQHSLKLSYVILLEYFEIVLLLLPSSSNANLSIEIEGMHGRDSLWSIFIKASSRVLTKNLYSEVVLRTGEGSQILKLWKDTVASFLSRGADVNADLAYRGFFVLRWQESRCPVVFEIEETPLAFVKGRLAHVNASLSKEMEHLLTSYSGLERMSVLSIGEGYKPSSVWMHRLTREQSQRLLKMQPWRIADLRYWRGPSVRDVKADNAWLVEPTPEAEEVVNRVLVYLEEARSKAMTET